jgi:hypothetical protein
MAQTNPNHWTAWKAAGKPFRGVDEEGNAIAGKCRKGTCDCDTPADCLASCPHVPGTACLCACHQNRPTYPPRRYV